MKFILTIELGNDAMQTQGDIGDALQRVATFLNASCHARIRHRCPEAKDSGSVRDINGNRVGGWHVED